MPYGQKATFAAVMFIAFNLSRSLGLLPIPKYRLKVAIRLYIMTLPDLICYLLILVATYGRSLLRKVALAVWITMCLLYLFINFHMGDRLQIMATLVA